MTFLLLLRRCLVLMILVSGTALGEASPLPVALYVDRGAWGPGKVHLRAFFKKYQIPFIEIDRQEILDGGLQTTRYSALLMPGGESSDYLATLKDIGAEQIRRFVAAGGGYFGICAGAFYATSLREGGNATGPWGIGLLDGVAYDGTALGAPGFHKGMVSFDVWIGGGFKPLNKILLLGGPSFHYTPAEARKKEIRVVARFGWTGESAMLAFQYGHGRVFFSSPHLEIEERNFYWGLVYKDPESDWPILESMLKWVRGGSFPKD